jgi:hypothetical protein
MTVFHSSCVNGRIVKFVTGPGRVRFIDFGGINAGTNDVASLRGDGGRLVSDKPSSLREIRWLMSAEDLRRLWLETMQLFDFMNRNVMRVRTLLVSNAV